MVTLKRPVRSRVKDPKLTSEQLTKLYSTFPEQLLEKTVAEWMNGDAIPQEVRDLMGAWANAWAARPIPEGVTEVGHRLVLQVAGQIAAGADLRSTHMIKASNRATEKPKSATIARDVFLLAKPHGTMTLAAATRKVAAKWRLDSPEDVRQVYYRHREALEAELDL